MIFLTIIPLQKEFVSPTDGKVYIEAEPDLEYFLRCKSERGVRSPRTLTLSKIVVDSTSLGYRTRFEKQTQDLGLWKSEGGVSSYVALRFVLKRTRATIDPASAAASAPPVGRITAKFYECVRGHGLVEHKDRDKTNLMPPSAEQDPTAAFSAMAHSTGKKAFASVAGSTLSVPDSKPRGAGSTAVAVARAPGSTGVAVKPEKKPVMKQRYDQGRLLGEVTIHYTSALGFIHLGILPRAPAAAAETSSGGRTRGGDAAAGGEEPDRKRVKTERAAANAVNDEPIDLTLDSD